ncbi:unnamed protein product [Urochloa humidicola]
MSPADPRNLPRKSLGCGSLHDAPDECSPPPVVLPAPPSLYPPLPPHPSFTAGSHGRRTFVTALIVATTVLASLAIFISILILVRRRRLRRQRDALLGSAPATTFPDDGDGGGGGPGEEEVVHHAWHIRTVGLDEAAIESIALTRYHAGAPGGASDDGCTVCLGEFRDGELIRLLPKCAHAFHVQCIDTWLRAHVTCPLCRANVIDTSAAGEQSVPTPPAPGAGAEQEEHDTGNNVGAPEHEHAIEQRAQVDQGDPPDISSEQPRQRPGPRPRTFRRVASMDSPLSPVASAEEALPEHGQAGGEKQGTGSAVCCEVSPGSGRPSRDAMKRSLSAGSRWTLLSRPCRQRSSLLPL